MFYFATALGGLDGVSDAVSCVLQEGQVGVGRGLWVRVLGRWMGRWSNGQLGKGLGGWMNADLSGQWNGRFSGLLGGHLSGLLNRLWGGAVGRLLHRALDTSRNRFCIGFC